MYNLLGEEFEREIPVLEDNISLDEGNSVETQQPIPEVNNSSHVEDSRLIDRARAVGVAYEFAKPGVETEDERRKRQRRNQRRVTDEERRLREVVGDLPSLFLWGQVGWRIMHMWLYVHLRWSR